MLVLQKLGKIMVATKSLPLKCSANWLGDIIRSPNVHISIKAKTDLTQKGN